MRREPIRGNRTESGQPGSDLKQGHGHDAERLHEAAAGGEHTDAQPFEVVEGTDRFDGGEVADPRRRC